MSDVEIFCFATAMVLANEVLNNFRQLGFVGAFDAFFNMVNNNLGALEWVEIVVRVYASLIFGEESGIA